MHMLEFTANNFSIEKCDICHIFDLLNLYVTTARNRVRMLE